MASYLAEVVGFLLLIAFIYKYVRPPLRRLMASQAAAISSSISTADAAVENGERTLAEARVALERAHLDATAIVERAHETSAQLRLEGERRGREEYDRLVASAAAESDLERQRAREEITREMGAVVVSATERVVAAEMDETVQRSFISETIAVAEAMT